MTPCRKEFGLAEGVRLGKLAARMWEDDEDYEECVLDKDDLFLEFVWKEPVHFGRLVEMAAECSKGLGWQCDIDAADGAPVITIEYSRQEGPPFEVASSSRRLDQDLARWGKRALTVLRAVFQIPGGGKVQFYKSLWDSDKRDEPMAGLPHLQFSLGCELCGLGWLPCWVTPENLQETIQQYEAHKALAIYFNAWTCYLGLHVPVDVGDIDRRFASSFFSFGFQNRGNRLIRYLEEKRMPSELELSARFGDFFDEDDRAPWLEHVPAGTHFSPSDPEADAKLQKIVGHGRSLGLLP